jgi:3-hydroxymyristoyl/3-hydroxydecanoyl-(acyl carrier protein) dehydratase
MAAAQTHARDVRVSSEPHALTTCLDGHPWLAGAHAGDAVSGVLLLLNANGIGALRQHGRQALLDHVRAHVGECGASSPQIWRLLGAAPDDLSPHALDALLLSPRPDHVVPMTEREQDGIWTLVLRLPPELIHFDGHFPQAPVLPGVLQVGWALALAAPRLGTSMQCREMESLKFQQLLRPCDEVELTLRLDAARGKLHFAYHLAGAHASSGRLYVEQAHE